MAISHCYWHLVVQHGNFTLLLASSGQEWWFHIATDIQWSRMAISHCYWHLVVKNGNFTLLLTSHGQEWQFHTVTDISWSRMAISHCYWHLMVKNGNFTLLLTSHGQEWPFHIATDISWSRMAISHCYWHCYWNINHEGSYLPGVICNIVVKAHFGRSSLQMKCSTRSDIPPNLSDEVTKIRCEMK